MICNGYLAAGGEALGVRAGQAYVDVGTLHGYRAAISLLGDVAERDGASAQVKLGWPAGRSPDRAPGTERGSGR